MNNLKYENEMNDLDDKENKQIEGLDTEGLDIEVKKSYSLKEELNRVIHFYKEQPTILIIVLFITYLLYCCFKNNNGINIISNVKKLNMKGGYEEEKKHLMNSIFELFINTKLWNKLKQQFNYDDNILNKIVVVFGYIFLGFIVRPIKAFFFVVIVLVGISGSFLFPFLVFGIMLYYVFKKVIFNKKPNFD
jgi:hypothetical protein